MFDLHPNTILILGPPGTGKTTMLHKLFKKEVKSGIPKSKIAFLSFTRQATKESRLKLGEDAVAVPWVKTLHSLTYNSMGLNIGHIFGQKHYQAFGERMGLTVKKHSVINPLAKQSKGTLMLFLHNLSEIKMQDLKVTWQNYAPDTISWVEQKYFSDSYQEYKDSNQLYDFTDVLKLFLKSNIELDLDVLMIDEAQDLSKIQWELVKKISKKVQRVYVAGDDDQSIFAWSGAEFELFLSLKTKQTIVLHQSHRLPETVHEFAGKIIERVNQRYLKEYTPAPRNGILKSINSLYDLDLSSGEWLILARDKVTLVNAHKTIYQWLIPFSSKLKSPLDCTYTKVLLDYLTALETGRTTSRALKRILFYGTKLSLNNLNLLERTSTKLISLEEVKSTFNFEFNNWFEYFQAIPIHHRIWLRTLLKNKEDLTKPRITLSTIHSVKGSECDNVVVFGDMAKKNFKNYELFPDTEHRVFYVAATRAKKNLYIVNPRTAFHYDWPIPPAELLGEKEECVL